MEEGLFEPQEAKKKSTSTSVPRVAIAKWRSNSPLLYCLWQTAQSISAPQVNTRNLQEKTNFILICFIEFAGWSLLQYFCFPYSWWQCFAIIFLPLLVVLVPKFSSSFLDWNSRQHRLPTEKRADAVSKTLIVLLAMILYFVRKSIITLIQSTLKLASNEIPMACWVDFSTFMNAMTSKRVSGQEATLFLLF